MSAKSDQMHASFADQLSSFDDKLAVKADDLQLLAEIQQGIGRLLEASGGNDAGILRMLRELRDAGELRTETFQLVKSMLDRYVSEDVPTSQTHANSTQQVIATVPPEEQNEPPNEDPFASTDVIPGGVLQTEDADSRVQVGSVLRDRFVLQERVSGGSMGVVYKALDRRLAEAGSQEPWVAIKVLAPQLSRNGNALRALQQEAAKSRCLTHPNIVRFVDFDRDEDLYFIVLEWLEGRTLADILDSPDSHSIDFETSFRIVRQIGRALEYAHRCGIVHADVKPGNIMMLPNGDAKLFDFGVARVQQQQRHDDEDFDPGVLGALTPAYSSMQVLTAEDPVPADDVFSLACLLYRLVAGYRVFGPRNAAEAADEGMVPQRLVDVTEQQWAAIKKALSYSRVTRFDSVAAFLDALDAHGEGAVNPPRVGHHVEFEDHGGVWRYVFALAALLSLLGFAAYQFGLVDELVRRLNLPRDGIEAVPAAAVDVRPALVDDGIVERPNEPMDRSLPENGAAGASVGESQAEQPVTQAARAVIAGQRQEMIADGPDGTVTGADTTNLADGEIERLDFSQLPPADAEVRIVPGSFEPDLESVTIREDSRPAIVDFVRIGSLRSALKLRLEEVGFSGNRSPWRSGQYEISNDGIVEFPPGQNRARIMLTMASDSRREADQQSTLRVREVDAAAIELAAIDVVLEDDDQRLFESQLPDNTVAFATSRISVLERDPAVQVDLLRFNPDDTSLVVDFAVNDVTAAATEDYFPPSNFSILFGPGQRSARILIPLVQDSDAEGAEGFVVELLSGEALPDTDVHRRIMIVIRDDDGAR